MSSPNQNSQNKSLPTVSLLLHNIRSVYNVGSLFRTADCLGVNKIWLSGYTPAPIDRFGRQRNGLAKVALGTQETVEWESFDAISVINRLRNDGYEIVVLEQSTNSLSLPDYQSSTKTNKPILLIPGTETTGVDIEIINLADAVIEILQQGTKESLNVSVATGIALWALLGPR